MVVSIRSTDRVQCPIMKEMIKIVVVPMHKDGRKFVLLALLATTLLFFLWKPLAVFGLAISIWCYYFFRDPERVIPQREGLVVSPADGIVSSIAVVSPPSELKLGSQQTRRVSVFMNLFNCHVNRAPVGGQIVRTVYSQGEFINASLNKASENNERNGIVIQYDHDDNIHVGVVQIAGLVARRILSFVAAGDQLRVGERFGLIRFGSRLDVYLPMEVAITVAVGQSTIAGETVIADLNAHFVEYHALTS